MSQREELSQLQLTTKKLPGVVLSLCIRTEIWELQYNCMSPRAAIDQKVVVDIHVQKTLHEEAARARAQVASISAIKIECCSWEIIDCTSQGWPSCLSFFCKSLRVRSKPRVTAFILPATCICAVVNQKVDMASLEAATNSYIWIEFIKFWTLSGSCSLCIGTQEFAPQQVAMTGMVCMLTPSCMQISAS